MSIEIKPEDLHITTFRPKGFDDHRGVEILHVPSGVMARESSSGSQHLNRTVAMDRLARELQAAEKAPETKEPHFKTKAEIWQYLLDGGALRHKKTAEIAKLVNGHTRFSFDTPSNWEPVPKPKPWYENIPEQGVLCWISDKDEAHRTNLAVIKAYSNGDPYAFSCNLGSFRYATPVKIDEIQDLIYKPE